MHYYEVAPSQIVRIDTTTLTYASESSLLPGHIVTISVGKKTMYGVIIREVSQPSYETKKVLSLIESAPIPHPLISLAIWLSSYYVTPLPTVLQTVLPRGLQKTRRKSFSDTKKTSFRIRTKKVFTEEQQHALTEINAASPGSILLHGITGSGKTYVYIELAKQMLAQGKSVILLVPEIALTSQLVDEFSQHFNSIILTHSKQTEAERHLAWREALYSTLPRIIIGPRSALFLPLNNLGLIIIDEAHEPSFKQEQSPRYSALRAASTLASYYKAKVIFGSATPSITDYYLANHSNRPIVRMTKSAREDTVKPTVTLVDMTHKQSFREHRFLSNTLLVHIKKALTNHRQVLIFHNRRGSASTTLCENCGWTALCPNCFVPFTLHADNHLLRCHICNTAQKVPTSCPVCNSINIIHKGLGTKLIESELKKLFPNTIIARFDGDTASTETVEQKYKQLYEGDIEIIIGTQVIAKGLDLPNLRIVGVIQADAGLSIPEYGSSERTFQLLAQVIGRVGRSHHPTQVIVQTYQPTHPAVIDGLTQNYEHFYSHTLAERKRGAFPPFTYLLKLVCIYKTEAATIKNTQKLATELRQKVPNYVQILGPVPCFYERQHDTYRWQLVVKSPKRADLVSLLEHLPRSHWQFELDPISLL